MASSEITEDRLLEVLSRHIGKDKGVHVDDLVDECTRLTHEKKDQGYLERRVRKLVEKLRNDGYHICAHPRSGYYIAADEAELMETLEYLHDRAMCSLRQICAMRKVSVPDLRGQLRLPT